MPAEKDPVAAGCLGGFLSGLAGAIMGGILGGLLAYRAAPDWANAPTLAVLVYNPGPSFPFVGYAEWEGIGQTVVRLATHPAAAAHLTTPGGSG